MIFNLIGPSGESGGGGTPPTPPAPIDKTIYVPASGGWASENAGSDAQLRMVIEQEYNSSSNTSTLRIKLQGKTRSGGSWASLTGTKYIYGGGYVKIDGNTVYTFPSTNNDYIVYNANNSWATVKSGVSGSDLVITTTKNHASNGSASISIDLYLNIQIPDYYPGDSYFSFMVSTTVTLTDGLDVVEDEDLYELA